MNPSPMTLCLSLAAVLAAGAVTTGAKSLPTASAAPAVEVSAVLPVRPADPEAGAPNIQVALLLDHSGSMKGLLEQAKAALWKVVNDLATIWTYLSPLTAG